MPTWNETMTLKNWRVFLWVVINNHKIHDILYNTSPNWSALMMWTMPDWNCIYSGQVIYKTLLKEDIKIIPKSSLSWALSMWPRIMTKSTNHGYSQFLQFIITLFTVHIFKYQNTFNLYIGQYKSLDRSQDLCRSTFKSRKYASIFQ